MIYLKVMKHIVYLLLILTVLLNKSCSSDTNHDYPPILVLASDQDFGTYTNQILKAEGFNEFVSDSLSDRKVKINYLKRFSIIILGETVVTQSQTKMLSDYVNSGGNLIAFRPDKQLYDIFGISHTEDTVREGYIKINSLNETGIGLVAETIQFHGLSDVCKLNGGQEIARLYFNETDSSAFPAVVMNKYGKGKATAFTYNLPESIVYTRQGNPEWAGEERDKVDGPTATDLFYPVNGETQWNNPAKIAIPQADEQMHLLSHIIEKFISTNKPLPRFWYFPDHYKCIFIFTIDGEDTPESDINNEIIDIQGKGGNVTLFEMGTYISASAVNRWRSDGHEVAIHFNDVPNYSNPTFLNMSTVLDTMTANFRNAYGISSLTVRNHWAVWCSKDSLGRKQFAEQAALEEKTGLGFDCNYYQFGGNKVFPNWMGDVGHFTGSGIPMKFAEASGRVLNIYQSNTQLPDETWLKENIESKCKTLIDRSLDEENFTYINANFHTWYWPDCREPGLRVLDYCNKRGVPVWTAERVYKFLVMKDEASFSDIFWKENHLSFTINSSVVNPDGLTFFLPVTHDNSKISSITSEGLNLKYQTMIVKGFEYAMATVASGRRYKISAVYSSSKN